MTKNGLEYWQLDMCIGFRDAIFIIVLYILLLYLWDAISKRLPLAKSVFGYIGLQ